MPVAVCAKFFWIRFLVIWSIFSMITGFVFFKASRKPLRGATPRLVVIVGYYHCVLSVLFSD